MSWLTEGWSALVSFVVGGAGTGLLVKFWDHGRKKRAQSDNVALDMVEAYEERLKKVEGEHANCREEIARLHEFYSDMKSDLESLLLAIEIAPEKAAEAVRKLRSKGQIKVASAREAAQVAQSGDHVRTHVNAPVAVAKAVQRASIPKD